MNKLACLKKLNYIICAVIIILAGFFGGSGYVKANNYTLSSANSLNCGIKDFFSNLFGGKKEQENNMPTVYLGGVALGFTLQCNGVIVIAVGEVHTEEGVVSTIVEGQINNGDIVTKIDGIAITSVDVIADELQKQQISPAPVQLEISNGNGIRYAKIQPAKDIITGNYKLGLWVRDNSAGVGTLTYVREDNKRFGALGHSVCDIDTGVSLPVNSGNAYKCNIIGVTPSKKGTAGELKGMFLKTGTQIGTLNKNTENGVFGEADDELIKLLPTKLKVASRSQVKTGKASIFCTIDGTEVKEYSIEIIKASRQSKISNKSMVIRITDPELISKTGGIVQGMSGSPIVQNGMLVGAVTHVFVSDPTKGYGIYAEWMLSSD